MTQRQIGPTVSVALSRFAASRGESQFVLDAWRASSKADGL